MNAFVEGKTHIVQFRLGGYAPLTDPQQGQRTDIVVHAFSDQVRQALSPSYPDYAENDGSGLDKRRSATLGPLPSGLLDNTSDEGAKFEEVVRYMSDALLGPQAQRLFFRIASIRKGDKGTSESLSNDGHLHVTAGNHYKIDIAHYQRESPLAGAVVEVSAPKGIDLLTPGQLPVRSKYDVVPVRFFAPFRDDEMQGELILRVKEPAQGASVRIPFRVRPSATHSVAFPALAILGTFCVAVPAILGATASLELRLGGAGVGAILVGLGVWARKSKGLAA